MLAAMVVEGWLHVGSSRELLRALDAPRHRPVLVRSRGDRLVALRAPQGREPGRRRRCIGAGGGCGGGGGGGGGGDEDPEPGGRPRGAQAVVLVSHVRDLLVAGDRHDDVLEALVREAVHDGAHLGARGQQRCQVAEGHGARHDEDARLAADVPGLTSGDTGLDEAAAVAAHQLHVRVVAAEGSFWRHDHERGDWIEIDDRVGLSGVGSEAVEEIGGLGGRKL